VRVRAILALLLTALASRAAGAAAVVDRSGFASAALDALPRAPLPEDHPCRLPDERFVPFHEKDGIVIRTAQEADGMTVVRSVVEIAASVEKTAGVLADIEGWVRWVKRLRAVERVPSEPPAFRLVVDAPWPFSDRDYGIAPAVDRDARGAPVVWWESAAERIGPQRRGLVRVTRIRGGFTLEPGTAAGSTRVVYSDVAVLGGRLPRWAVRESYRRGPVGILGSLRRLLAQPM